MFHIRNAAFARTACKICAIVFFAPFFLPVSRSLAVEGLTLPKRDVQTITVGGANSDIPGFTSRAIQIAVDALKANNGGIVHMGAGVFEISAPIRLYSHISLVGSGETTVLHKIDGVRANYVLDADYGMLKATVKNVSGFKVGMGIYLYDDKFRDDCWGPTTGVISSIAGNVIYFDTYLVQDYIASLNGIISNACPIVEAIEAEDIRMADFTVDGNASTNESISGCRGGGIYVHKSRNILVENVKVHHFNGDCFSWQITENITVRNCEAAFGTNLGFHPGTGSDQSIVENCRSHDNKSDGIYLCWRVQNGIFRNNTVYANGEYGISIGHKDTDNIFENNRVYENKNHGVYFREENEENAGHRNRFQGNTIENNGTAEQKAWGFYIDGQTHDITIEGNTIRSTGKGNQAGAIFIGAKASRVAEKNNTISGHAGVQKASQ
jgi:parallel beta-helix repeat protein